MKERIEVSSFKTLVVSAVRKIRVVTDLESSEESPSASGGTSGFKLPGFKHREPADCREVRVKTEN